MKHELIRVRLHSSEFAKEFGIIVTVRSAQSNRCQIVIGSPGLPNSVKDPVVGDSHLFQTSSNGLVEIRAMATSLNDAEFLVSQVSPTSGLLGGSATVDFVNSPFSDEEVVRIASSLESIQNEVASGGKLTSAQLELLTEKLADIASASTRLGRKDWINYVASTLTSVVVTAGISPETGQLIFATANTAFKWLFSQGVLLLT